MAKAFATTRPRVSLHKVFPTDARWAPKSRDIPTQIAGHPGHPRGPFRTKNSTASKSGEIKVSTSTVAALFSKNGLDRPKNRYGRYGFPSFYSIFTSTAGVDGARVCLWRFSFLALWVVVVDISQFPANSLRREKNAMAIAKRYGECSEVLFFLGERGRKTVQGGGGRCDT